MKPEEKARQTIDKLLTDAGWTLQNMNEINLAASSGVVIREFPLTSGVADYVFFINGKAAGVIEAKPEGTTLSGVAEQSDGYIATVPKNTPKVREPLPFAYESTGAETLFRDLRDPEPRSRLVFAFHRPETLQEWLTQKDTLRARLRTLPPLITTDLRDCQIEALTGLEQSLSDAKPRALIQMASGGGKTFTAITSCYRMIKFANAKRILFLVDRKTLGRQAFQEFSQYTTPDDGRKFTELYNVQPLTSNTIDTVSKVCITTIQRLYSMLKSEPEFDESLEEQSLFNLTPREETEMPVTYDPKIPIEMFDVIIVDECHRSIYNLWRQVLDYFDAFIIGLTATPDKQTLGFFYQNIVSEYPHERAVADAVNVPYEVYRIKTEITEKGSMVESGFYIDKRDKLTRKIRWEQLDEDFEYSARQLDRNVVSHDQIRTVIKTLKEKLFTDIFPGRTEVPKTLVFAKDDSHAEDIVHIAREEFGKGNDFCKKITYRTTGEKPEDLISAFRNSYNPRIAVTVDMISTGTDIKPIECLLFMRDIKSRTYFEQMKGRGTRIADTTELQQVTPDAKHKTHFIIVDAVGVCESDKTDSRPLERKRTVPFEKLLTDVALGIRDEDTLSSLAARLARMEKETNDKDREEIHEASSGKSLKELTNALLDATDPDVITKKAQVLFKTDAPTNEHIQKAAGELTKTACEPFNKPELRNTLIDIKKRNEQTIDTVSKDAVIFAGYDEHAKEKAKTLIDTFKKFIEENKDVLTALQILYSKPYAKRHLTYEHIKQLADAIRKPPYHLMPQLLWNAYEQLEKSRVRGAGPDRLLTDIISLIRFTLGQADVLEPFTETVNRRFETWIAEMEKSGKTFTAEQREWLLMIKDHVATSASITLNDFELSPFHQKGGAARVYKLFENELDKLLEDINDALVA